MDGGTRFHVNQLQVRLVRDIEQYDRSPPTSRSSSFVSLSRHWLRRSLLPPPPPSSSQLSATTSSTSSSTPTTLAASSLLRVPSPSVMHSTPSLASTLSSSQSTVFAADTAAIQQLPATKNIEMTPSSSPLATKHSTPNAPATVSGFIRPFAAVQRKLRRMLVTTASQQPTSATTKLKAPVSTSPTPMKVSATDSSIHTAAPSRRSSWIGNIRATVRQLSSPEVIAHSDANGREIRNRDVVESDEEVPSDIPLECKPTTFDNNCINASKSGTNDVEHCANPVDAASTQQPRNDDSTIDAEEKACMVQLLNKIECRTADSYSRESVDPTSDADPSHNRKSNRRALDAISLKLRGNNDNTGRPSAPTRTTQSSSMLPLSPPTRVEEHHPSVSFSVVDHTSDDTNKAPEHRHPPAKEGLPANFVFGDVGMSKRMDTSCPVPSRLHDFFSAEELDDDSTSVISTDDDSNSDDTFSVTIHTAAMQPSRDSSIMLTHEDSSSDLTLVMEYLNTEHNSDDSATAVSSSILDSGIGMDCRSPSIADSFPKSPTNIDPLGYMKLLTKSYSKLFTAGEDVPLSAVVGIRSVIKYSRDKWKEYMVGSDSNPDSSAPLDSTFARKYDTSSIPTTSETLKSSPKTIVEQYLVKVKCADKTFKYISVKTDIPISSAAQPAVSSSVLHSIAPAAETSSPCVTSEPIAIDMTSGSSSEITNDLDNIFKLSWELK